MIVPINFISICHHTWHYWAIFPVLYFPFPRPWASFARQSLLPKSTNTHHSEGLAPQGHTRKPGSHWFCSWHPQMSLCSESFFSHPGFRLFVCGVGGDDLGKILSLQISSRHIIYVDKTTMGHLHNGLLLSRKKENFILCDSMDGPGECYAEWNKPVGERQLPHDFTRM